MTSNSGAPPFMSSRADADDDDDDDVEALAARTSDDLSSILNQLGGSKAEESTSNNGSSDVYKKKDSMELLASKACALASLPVPDYSDSFDQENERLKKKYGGRFVIEEEDDDGDDAAGEELVLDSDSNSIVLAAKTTQILSNFQDYVSGIGGRGEGPGNAGKDILEGGVGGEGDEEATLMTHSMATTIRADNKMRLLEGGDASQLRGSDHSNYSSGQLQREWASHTNGQVQNLHDLGLEGFGEEDDSDAEMTMIQRGQKYTHPLLQSKRIQFGLINCVLVTAIVLGVSLGVSSNNKKAGQELENQIDKVEEDLSNGINNHEENKDWWKLQQQTVGQPTSESDAEKIVQTVTENGVYSPQKDPVITQEELDLYQSVVAQYQPREFNRQEGWIGKTYLDAYKFCGEQNYDICPSNAICPFGPDTQPLGGYKERIDGSWVPIADKADDWVQLSRENACVKYSDENHDPPEWGIDGGEDADEVAHVMCCTPSHDETKADAGSAVVPGGEMEGNPNFQIYQSITEVYLPLEFDRSNGWEGRTYIDALQFCGTMAGYEICPYEAICPFGPDNTPISGVKDDENNGAWVPILNGGNDWVQLGMENTCIKYSREHKDPPSWGTGKGDEEMTQHVICCVLLGDNTDETASDEEEEDSSSDEQVSQEAPPFVTDPAFAAYNTMGQKYRPLEFSRDDGWDGRTYAQADYFCGTLNGNYHICPYDAICPLGPGTTPLMGYKIGFADAVWMPILDQVDDWVQVDESDPCVKFSGKNSNPPDWGVTGNGSAEITGYIACCVIQDGDDEGGSNGGGDNEGGGSGDNPISKEALYETDLVYKFAAETYKPLSYNRERGWTGQTYVDAFSFCGQHDGRSICPYEALCPMGPGGEPLGGYTENEEGDARGMWMPVMLDDEEGNDWVQVSTANPCVLYSTVHSEGPEWGLTGENNEEITRHVICCVGDSMTGILNEDEAKDEGVISFQTQVFENDLKHFVPKGYTRENGWDGKTYLEAVQFCAKDEGYEICPYEAICPLGTNSMSIFGNLVSTHDRSTWVPISDDSNDWVDLSSEYSCIRYTAESRSKPEWGMTGENSEEFTTFISCCKGSIWGKSEESFLYEVAVFNHLPVWYDRDDGWTGQTYDEAVDFCTTTKGLSLCPYEAYCPVSTLDLPMGGVKDDGGLNGSWAPVSDFYNGWVSIGLLDTCMLYYTVVGENPKWGATGIADENMTRNIMCCNADEKDVVGPQEVMDVPVTEPPPTTPLVQTSMPTPFPTPLPSSEPTPSPTPLPSSEPTPPPTPLPSSEPTPPPTPLPSTKPTLPPISGAMGLAVESYKTVVKYNPVWYDRSSGWTGQTFDDAFTFCSGKGSNHDICPYEVICPGGPLKLPYEGTQAEPNGSWAPINEAFNSWVKVSDEEVCVRYMNLNPDDHPTWGLTGIDNEDITRHIACCDMDGAVADTHKSVLEKYSPKGFNRDEGWNGNSYKDAISFCASQDSSIPCPYEAYCPEGKGSVPTLGNFGPEEAWAAIMDVPNGWVQIGSYDENSISNSCMEYNSLHETPPMWGLFGGAGKDMTPHIMCCKEPDDGVISGVAYQPLSVATAKTSSEQEVLDEMDPVWFGRKHGYRGTTLAEASNFCQTIGDMVLCQERAYCPGTEEKLFLEKDPFGGDQWAPVASESGTGKGRWISVGIDQGTCATHEELSLAQPDWAFDGSRQELKENILCCQNPKYLAKEESLMKDLSPIWMNSSHGWDGGSHDEAIQFCEGFGNRKICPYSAYCPHGPGQSVIGGHTTDFNTEGEQWAPVYGETNHWVMIGQKYQNRATTCTSSQDLEGAVPDWGMSKENANIKKYILCCSF